MCALRVQRSVFLSFCARASIGRALALGSQRPAELLAKLPAKLLAKRLAKRLAKLPAERAATAGQSC
jgi:hypothetical protein